MVFVGIDLENASLAFQCEVRNVPSQYLQHFPVVLEKRRFMGSSAQCLEGKRAGPGEDIEPTGTNGQIAEYAK